MNTARQIDVDLTKQVLELLAGDGSRTSYPVSTALNGPGELIDSECTPRGRHEVAEKVGAHCVPNTVFVGRRPTGEIYTDEFATKHPGRDWILTRILWLSGLEPGVNHGGNCDTHARYIYIHGTPDSIPLGVPGSRGCIRMRNSDIVRLFEQVDIGTAVNIFESA